MSARIQVRTLAVCPLAAGAPSLQIAKTPDKYEGHKLLWACSLSRIGREVIRVILGGTFLTSEYRPTVFALASTSLLSLLAEFYHISSMRVFALFVSLPALVALLVGALFDRTRGSQRLGREIVVGSLAGLFAAFAYDIFRLPFVVAPDLSIDRILPPLQIFKVFPRFGAMILGQPLAQPVYSLLAQLVGWAYHFSNGLTFGIMYVALVGDARRRLWAWAVLFATGLELGMLFTPYPHFFGIASRRSLWLSPWLRIWCSGAVAGFVGAGLVEAAAPCGLSMNNQKSSG